LTPPPSPPRLQIVAQTRIGVKALASSVAVALAVGCSGGTSLAGEGDDDHAPDSLAEADVATVPDVGIDDAPDTGEDGICPGDAISGGGCAAAGATCRTATFCQQCAIDAWTWHAAYCWCAGGSWECSHVDCFPPYATATYSDPACTTPWGADDDADAGADDSESEDAAGDADAEPDAEEAADGDVPAGDGGCDLTALPRPTDCATSDPCWAWLPQAACEAACGLYDPGVGTGSPQCNCPTVDGGERCRGRPGECQAECVPLGSTGPCGVPLTPPSACTCEHGCPCGYCDFWFHAAGMWCWLLDDGSEMVGCS
jgi:hypothetical protein